MVEESEEVTVGKKLPDKNAKLKKKVSIFWFRRDLRLNDNTGLYHALKGKN